MIKSSLLILSQILIFAFWPVSFFVTNQPTNFHIFSESLKAGSVFEVTPLDYDSLVKKIGLFPNRNFARLEQNKLTPIISKYSLNFFSLIDPNNYFFGFHPRENVIQNQNLLKFPPLSLIFLLVGLYYWQNLKHNRPILLLSFLFIIILSFFTVFDGFDLILYLPISLIIRHGLLEFGQKKSFFVTPILLLFCFVSTIDLIRIVLIR
jgi:hypothetical protein